MALLARDYGVLAEQREAREIVIIRHLLTPGILVVALLAVGAKLAFMGVILLMAGDASGCQLIPVEVAFVAAFAADARMLPSQRELCLPRMVEADCFPFIGLVASVALCAVSAMVHILKLMA